MRLDSFLTRYSSITIMTSRSKQSATKQVHKLLSVVFTYIFVDIFYAETSKRC